MTVRRILLWGLPLVVGGLLIFFATMPPVIQKQEQALQAMRQKGWTVYLQDFATGISHGGQGQRDGDILIDNAGRIWVVGGGHGLQGVAVFDGTKWTILTGCFTDLAVSPQGEIWTTANCYSPESSHVFDGQKWKRYSSLDLVQVEINNHGRIWSIYGPQQLLAEIVQVGGHFAPRASYPKLSCGQINSLDADKQGRIWAAVRGEDECAGLYIIDGETLQRVPNQGMNLKKVVRTAFDKQGRTWVATSCGGVMMYDGKEWTSIIQGDTDPECGYPSRYLNGITVDSKDRVWIWNNEQVQMLEQGSWITLTEDNSGIKSQRPGDWIFGVAVDEKDRVWIGSSDGVRMAAVQDARPLPKIAVLEGQTLLLLKERMRGSIWFLPAAVAILWLAAYLNVWPGVLLALVVGLSATYLIGGPETGLYIISLNPGVFITLSGMVGGLVGGWMDRIHLKRRGSQTQWKFILAAIGLLFGFVLWVPYMIFWGP